MSKRIRIGLSAKSIAKAIREVEKYKAEFAPKCDEVARRITELGRDEAEKGFMLAQYDGPRHIEVTADKVGNTRRVVAQGKPAVFIEFGAGVTYNGTHADYPLPKPDGLVGIGEYGYEQGKNPTWSFTNSDTGEREVTPGNPAQMPMYRASVQMRQHIKDAAREVFGDD